MATDDRQTSTSKLGTVYNMKEIKATDTLYHTELRKMMSKGPNKICADCGVSNTAWCSINLGVFLCINCAQTHRSVGTHISKIKSCMGTYLWHPDEMERIRVLGNPLANEHYGGVVVNRAAMNNDEIMRAVRKKYENKPEPTRSISVSDATARRALTPSIAAAAPPASAPSVTLPARVSLESKVAPNPSNDDFFKSFGF